MSRSSLTPFNRNPTDHRLPQRHVMMRHGCRITGLSSSDCVLHARSWYGFEPPRHSAFSHGPT
ncbi:MAG: hypothetical protein HDS80_06130 [Bacteroidales bacterium]|nr:hypothetical protein [Bacteroidales bacterium]